LGIANGKTADASFGLVDNYGNVPLSSITIALYFCVSTTHTIKQSNENRHFCAENIVYRITICSNAPLCESQIMASALLITFLFLYNDVKV
jgi:hypothetical protein